MTDHKDDDATDKPQECGYASPPCFMHEVDPAYFNLPPAKDAVQSRDVSRWRTAERRRLTRARQALSPDLRRRHAARIIAHLQQALGPVAGLTISAYWPIRGEPNLRSLMEKIISGGGRCALPVVVERHKPLVFRCWSPGEPLSRGVWNIPVPGEEAAVVTPDVILTPLVGFDGDGYRLGNGGGYYDRTLAALKPRPRVFGVGYRLGALPTIYPQWHDVPMDAIVTEDGVHPPSSGDNRP